MGLQLPPWFLSVAMLVCAWVSSRLAGNAYVPSIALKQILAKRYRDALAGTLEVAFQGLPTALADPRIGGFLRDLQECVCCCMSYASLSSPSG